MAAFGVADEPATAVLDLTSPALSSELAELEKRLRVVQGLLDAHGRLNEVNRVVQFSADRAQALDALQDRPFGYTREQAERVLDMPISWQASDAGERLREERDELLGHRTDVHQHVAEVLALHWFG